MGLEEHVNYGEVSDDHSHPYGQGNWVVAALGRGHRHPVGNTHPFADAQAVALDDDRLTPRAEVLREAEKLICGTRQVEYGSPFESHARIAKLWSALLGVEIRPYQAAVMLALMKASRAMTDTKMDTFNDGAGYFALAYDILLEEDAR